MVSIPLIWKDWTVSSTNSVLLILKPPIVHLVIGSVSNYWSRLILHETLSSLWAGVLPRQPTWEAQAAKKLATLSGQDDLSCS
jgi:hypothetical protein